MLDLEPLAKPFNEFSTPLAKSAGETLQDIWDLVFGGFGTFVDKKRAKREKDLNDFKKSLENEVKQIPIENIKEPTLSILGPALEASKYYYEEPELRNMFAKLVAGSMDDRQTIHPCFIEIIKQLSPYDAKLLTLFSVERRIPICEIRKHKEQYSISFITTRSNIYASKEFPDIEANQLALTSLNKANLITLDYSVFFAKDIYNEIIKICRIDSKNKKSGWEKYETRNGIAKLTPLGEAFISVCL